MEGLVLGAQEPHVVRGERAEPGGVGEVEQALGGLVVPTVEVAADLDEKMLSGIYMG